MANEIQTKKTSTMKTTLRIKVSEIKKGDVMKLGNNVYQAASNAYLDSVWKFDIVGGYNYGFTSDGSHTVRVEREIAPEIGMGATYNIGSDSYAYTISKVNRTGKTIEVKADVRKGEDFIPNPNAKARIFTMRKSGYFQEKGADGRSGYLTIGVRKEYRDPSF